MLRFVPRFEEALTLRTPRVYTIPSAVDGCLAKPLDFYNQEEARLIVTAPRRFNREGRRSDLSNIHNGTLRHSG